MTMGKQLKQTFGLCLLFGFVLCIPVSTFYEDPQLYVGSPCELAGDKGIGICARLFNCTSKMQDLQQGRFDPTDRCGFDGDVEIVCCNQINITEKLNTARPADTACQEYENEVSRLNSPGVDFHILGAEDAKSREFPQMAALGYKVPGEDGNPDTVKYTCGGTLISRQHILTAAHCVNNREESVPFEVRLGSTDLTNDGTTTQHIEILSVKSHEGFRRSQNYDDIAIIKLKEPVRMTNSVYPACLMTKSLHDFVPTSDQTLIVLGWGLTEADAEEGSKKLQKAVGLRMVDHNDCANSYKNVPKLRNGLDNRTICAIDPNITRRADTCSGDSGGPLLISSGSAQPMVAGITAFGQFCGGSDPSVYMSVYSYLSWIEEKVWPSPEKVLSARIL